MLIIFFVENRLVRNFVLIQVYYFLIVFLEEVEKSLWTYWSLELMHALVLLLLTKA